MKNTLSECEWEIVIGWEWINNLYYVNDATKIAGTKEEMATLLSYIERASKRFWLTIHREKTKLMVLVIDNHSE